VTKRRYYETQDNKRLYRVSQEERAKLREGVPYVKLQTKDGSNVAWTDIAEEKGK